MPAAMNESKSLVGESLPTCEIRSTREVPYTREIITYVMMIIPWSKSDLARSPVEVFSGMRMWHGM